MPWRRLSLSHPALSDWEFGRIGQRLRQSAREDCIAQCHVSHTGIINLLVLIYFPLVGLFTMTRPGNGSSKDKTLRAGQACLVLETQWMIAGIIEADYAEAMYFIVAFAFLLYYYRSH